MTRINRDWIVPQEAALAAELKRELEISVRQAKGLIDGGCVKRNGEQAAGHGLRLKAGDQLHVNFDPAFRYDVLPPKKKLKADPFVVLYEDTHLLFVNKPSGLLTVPTEQGPQEDNLAEAITDHYKRRGFKRFQLFIVHRLDRFTSGVLVFAKTPEALLGLKKMFALHKLQRVYRAILVGELPENRGTLAGHLIEQTKSLKMRVVDPKKKHSEGSKEAITHYRVVERLPGHTVVEVQLETGRRNQIRVQFADKGYPLLGDQVYGEESPILDRQALHAELLGFKHPVTEEQVTVTAPLPSDMEAALKQLRNVRRLERAEAGIQGEEGIFKPKITKERKAERISRMKKFEAIAAERAEKGPARRPGRGGRPEGDGPSKREFKPRPEGERPAKREWKPRPDGERPAPRNRKPDGERPAKREWKPREDRPADRDRKPEAGSRKPDNDRPAKREFKPREDRPAHRAWKPRPDSDRPAPRERKPEGERPAKREWKPREDRPVDRDRKPGAGDRKPSGERPPRKEGGRAERRDSRPEAGAPAKREWTIRPERSAGGEDRTRRVAAPKGRGAEPRVKPRPGGDRKPAATGAPKREWKPRAEGGRPSGPKGKPAAGRKPAPKKPRRG